MTKPKWIFRERRPASARLESTESVAFRRSLHAEQAAEHRNREVPAQIAAAMDADIDGLVRRHAATCPDRPDDAALSRVARPLGVVRFGDVPVHAVEPLAPREDSMDFDRSVCEAGLKRFVRRAMDSDRPGRSESAGVAVFGDPPGWLLVLEIAGGVRCKRGVEIGWLQEPAESRSN